jgi:hypothetical protein
MRPRAILPPLLLALLVAGMALLALAEPSGVTVLSNATVTPTPQSAAAITTAGGSFTTLLLNATTQTLRWKAYVGNVTGSLTLDDAANYTIYDWNLATISGEVYASRNSTVNWPTVRCANATTLTSEQAQLSIATTKEDSINRTFNQTVHASFYVGTTLIQNSSCRAIATYVNSTRQSASESATFQEILLDDTQRVVYATVLESDAQGYNSAPFDFQMIVAENPTTSQASAYYFWAELS